MTNRKPLFALITDSENDQLNAKSNTALKFGELESLLTNATVSGFINKTWVTIMMTDGSTYDAKLELMNKQDNSFTAHAERVVKFAESNPDKVEEFDRALKAKPGQGWSDLVDYLRNTDFS